jgi:hypothetical protein
MAAFQVEEKVGFLARDFPALKVARNGEPHIALWSSSGRKGGFFAKHEKLGLRQVAGGQGKGFHQFLREGGPGGKGQIMMGSEVFDFIEHLISGSQTYLQGDGLAGRFS